MSKTKVLTGKERKAQILEAGARLAAKRGPQNVTRRDVAKACKCAEALVSVYMGGAADAQKAYARHARKLGLTLPDKATVEAIGVKMRAHGPRDKRDSRKRSVREVEAIKRKAVPAAKKASTSAPRETKPAPGRVTKPVQTPARAIPSPGTAPSAPERKATAARKPKDPPTEPLPLPPILSGSFP